MANVDDSMLQELDINRMSEKKTESNYHITRTEQDSAKSLSKDTAKHQLLSYQFVNDNGVTISACQLIKEMTTKLDYKWQYASYC